MVIRWLIFKSPNFHWHMFGSRFVFGTVEGRRQFLIWPIKSWHRYFSFGFGPRP